MQDRPIMTVWFTRSVPQFTSLDKASTGIRLFKMHEQVAGRVAGSLPASAIVPKIYHCLCPSFTVSDGSRFDT